MRALRLMAFGAALCAPQFALALDGSGPGTHSAELADAPATDDARTPTLQPIAGESSLFAHTFAVLAYGRGLRFSNPYRLQTELGSGPQTLSLTAGYADLGVGAAFGDPHGLRNGVVAHLSVATEGVHQEVLSLSYLLQYPVSRDFLGFARVGVPLVLEPDRTTGVELALGGAYLFSAGIGVSAELIQSLYLGAATWEHDPTLWPVLSAELGVWVQYEALP